MFHVRLVMESCAEFSGGIFGGQLEKPSFSWGLSQKERANGLGDRPNGHQQVSWVFLFKYTAAFLPVIVGLPSEAGTGLSRRELRDSENCSHHLLCSKPDTGVSLSMREIMHTTSFI